MATNELAHLPLDVRPIAALDAETRIAHIRAERWVQHGAADRVLGYMQEALTQPSRERMENILLVGESGMGKTMLVRKFERQNAVPFECAEPVDLQPTPARARFGPDEGAFGIVLTPSLTSLIEEVQHDLQAAMAETPPKRSWGYVESAEDMLTVVAHLTLCIVLATTVRCEPRIDWHSLEIGQSIRTDATSGVTHEGPVAVSRSVVFSPSWPFHSAAHRGTARCSASIETPWCQRLARSALSSGLAAPYVDGNISASWSACWPARTSQAMKLHLKA